MKCRIRFTCEWSCDYDVDVYDVETPLSKEQLFEELDKADRYLVDCEEDGYGDLGHTAETLVDYLLLDAHAITKNEFICGASELRNPNMLVVNGVDVEYEMR